MNENATAHLKVITKTLAFEYEKKEANPETKWKTGKTLNTKTVEKGAKQVITVKQKSELMTSRGDLY